MLMQKMEMWKRFAKILTYFLNTTLINGYYQKPYLKNSIIKNPTYMG